MSPAIRGLWPAQVAMVMTMTTMENMKEMPRSGCVMATGKREQMAKTTEGQGSLDSSSVICRDSKPCTKI